MYLILLSLICFITFSVLSLEQSSIIIISILLKVWFKTLWMDLSINFSLLKVRIIIDIIMFCLINTKYITKVIKIKKKFILIYIIK